MLRLMLERGSSPVLKITTVVSQETMTTVFKLCCEIHYRFRLKKSWCSKVWERLSPGKPAPQAVLMSRCMSVTDAALLTPTIPYSFLFNVNALQGSLLVSPRPMTIFTRYDNKRSLHSQSTVYGLFHGSP